MTRESADAAARRLIGVVALTELTGHGLAVHWADDVVPLPAAADFLVVSDLARFCDVDAKTIHNWVKRGALKAFRTPGRHLRFAKGDVVKFMAEHGYPIPSDLKTTEPSAL